MSSVLNKLKRQLKSALGFNKQVYTANKKYTLNVTNEPRFANQVIIVTGGGGAIGKAISKRLVADGAVVFILGRTESTLVSAEREIQDEVRDRGIIEHCSIDISDEEAVKLCFQRIFDKHGHIDALINCAGGGARDKAKDLKDQSLDIIKDVINSNLLGTIICSKYVAQYMVIQKGGRIVNFSSSIGLNGMERCVDYSASKSGMLGITKSLAKELGKHGITINCVTPGYIQKGGYSLLEEDHIKETNYLNRVGTLEDVAGAVAFLLSEDSAFITGQNIVVDGGRTLGLKGSQ